MTLLVAHIAVGVTELLPMQWTDVNKQLVVCRDVFVYLLIVQVW